LPESITRGVEKRAALIPNATAPLGASGNDLPEKASAQMRKMEMGKEKNRGVGFLFFLTFGPGEKFPSEPPS
jgi:hypothetical protein